MLCFCFLLLTLHQPPLSMLSVFSVVADLFFHTRSTHALLCLGSWSLAGLVRNEDVETAVKLDEVDAMLELNRLAKALACIIP